jgi:hypothetical protein
MLRASLVAVAVLFAAPALADGEPDVVRKDVPVPPPQADCVDHDKTAVKKPTAPQGYGYQVEPRGYGYGQQVQPRGYGYGYQQPYQMRPAMMPPAQGYPMHPPVRGY